MSYMAIPFDPSLSACQSFTVNLGDAQVSFSLQWNGRAGAWFCGFATSDGSEGGVKLTAGRDLLTDPDALGLAGNFRVLQFTAMAGDLGYANFGGDWRLVYATAEEWEAYDGVE